MLKSKLRLFTSVVAFLIFVLGLSAQPLFEHISSDEGLSENVVNVIFQDSRGFMWFGTNDGLSKYDGNKFTIYKPDFTKEGSISSNLIFALTEDTQGNIWIGTTGSGISKFDSQLETFTNYKADPSDKERLNSDYIKKLFTDSKGRIWVASADALQMIDPTSPQISFQDCHFDIVEKDLAILDLNEDKQGNMWVATRDGIYMAFAEDSNEGIQFKKQDYDLEKYGGFIPHFVIDDHNRLIILKGGHILYQDAAYSSSFTSLGPVSKARCLLYDMDGKVWVGSDTGLHCYEKKNGEHRIQLTKHYVHNPSNLKGLSRNLVNYLYQDKHGIIWVGVNGDGINKFDPNRKAFTHIEKLSKGDGGNEKIRSVIETHDGLFWVGTEGDGLFYTDIENDPNLEKPFNRMPGPTRPFALFEVKLGEKKWLYIGSEDTPLSRIDLSKQERKLEPIQGLLSSVFSILQDKSGNLWLGTYSDGIHRWTYNEESGDFKKSRFVHDINDSLSLSNNIIRKIIQDSRGNIWLGTGGGLNKISADQVNAENIDFEVYRNEIGNEKSISHDYILDMLETRNGDLWIGTFGGGVNKLVPSGAGEISFETYSEADGLANNTIKSLLEDPQGNLWISSNKGLTKLDPDTKTIFNFSLKDGLQGNEFAEVSAYLRSNGDMFFGGVNGFNIFNPENISISTNDPDVYLTDFYILNKRVKPNEKFNGRVIIDKTFASTDKIKLAHNENNFSIEFAALEYLSPGQIQYKYMLEGYDEDWNMTSSLSRLANYTNLKQGKYTFIAKATNADGIWSDKEAKIDISIRPPFWLTWYAYLFYGIVGFGLLWIFRRYELIGIKEKNDLRVAKVEREKREAIHDLKLRFFTNISHELRTPLTLIIAPLENLLKKGSSISADKVSEQYHLMYKNSKYLLRLVDQLLDFRKLDQGKLNLEAQQGNIVEFVKEASQPFQFIASKQNVSFKVESEDEAIYLWFDPDILEKILYNLLSNAFKYTPADGKITVRLSTVEEESKGSLKKRTLNHYLKLEVIDTGQGIPSKIKNKIFERFYKEVEDKFTKDGAGIGLSFTESLVKRHYGEISLKSKVGEGSNFIVKLPMSKSVFNKSEITNSQINAHKFTADPLEYFTPEKPKVLPEIDATGSEREHSQELPLLLFVDDNADIRKFIKSGFENDFRIVEAENGVKGLEMAKSSLPDIIISDVMMPEMDGIEMCKLVKDNVETSHIPIVLLTAKTNQESEIEGLGTGADAYVKKPFKLDILKQQIINIYDQREKLKSKFRKEIILQPSEITVTSVDEEFLQRAVGLVEEHMSDADFNVEALVKEMYISRSKLYLKIKALTGYSTSEFIRTVRLKRAVQLLEKSDYTIKEIMFMTGFNTASYFSKCFKKLYGIVPSEYVRIKKDELVNVGS